MKKKYVTIFLTIIILLLARCYVVSAEVKTGQVEAVNQKLLSSVLVGKSIQTDTLFDKITSVYNECSLFCRNTNNYTYSFGYENQIEQDPGNWKNYSGDSLNKCMKIRTKFSVIGDWGLTLDKQCVDREEVQIVPKVYVHTATPPTNISNCENQEGCLNEAKEYVINPSTTGRGIHQVPTNFVADTEKSITSGNGLLPCSDGICSTLGSGVFKLTTTAKETNYYAQCKGYGFILNPPAVKIPAIASTLNLTVENRPPIATVSFDKSLIKAGETVKVHCDIIDPDDCVDKIVKVKWNCMDSTGSTTDCFFLDQNQIYRQGQLFKEITPTNPYRDTVDLKLTKKEIYGVTCEAWDNDGANAMSGMGVKSITVDGPVCIADGVCNRECPNDPDCGVIPEGSCFVTRIKPSYEIKKIKPKTAVTYQAQIFGGVNPIKYTWFCDKNEAQKDERMSSEKKIEHTCDNYILDNHTYEPKAMYSYKKEDGSIGETECKNNDGTAVTTDGIAPSKPGFCMIVPEKGGSNISACGDKATAKFKVYSNYEFNNPEYVWSNCNGATNSSSVECNYTTSELSQKFTPALTVKDNGEEIKCPSSTSISLYREASCNVLSRVKDSGEDYGSVIKATVGEILESKIERKCLDPKEAITWSFVNATLQSQDNDTHTASLNVAGETTISAKAKVGSKDINCKSSLTTVKEKIEIGQ